MHKNLNELRDKAYAQSVTTGWHKERLSNDHFKCLIITELSEAVQADRSIRRAQMKTFKDNALKKQPHQEIHWKFCFETFIKDTVEDELSDAVIRCLDFAGVNGIDLQATTSTFDYLICQDKTFTENIYAIIREFTNPAWHVEDHLKIALSMIYKLAEVNGIGLDEYVELKMKYNEMRAWRHGGKKY